MTNCRFVYLKEITVTATAEPSPVGAHFDDFESEALPTLPSAAEHYAAACGHLAEAETAGTPVASVHAFIELANARLRAGQLAVALWPGPPSSRAEVEEFADLIRRARAVPDPGE